MGGAVSELKKYFNLFLKITTSARNLKLPENLRSPLTRGTIQVLETEKRMVGLIDKYKTLFYLIVLLTVPKKMLEEQDQHT